MFNYTTRFLEETCAIANRLEPGRIERMVDILVDVRSWGGRVFFLGVGGGAGHAGHAVNDFRKIAAMECYAPSDNVSELTARINDDGWDTCYANWLKGSRLGERDALFVFSVGGGSIENNVSMNLVNSLKLAKEVGARVLGIVGRDGGFTAQVADEAVVIPMPSPDTVTAHTEAFQAVVWHLLVSHPRLRAREMKWESASAAAHMPLRPIMRGPVPVQIMTPHLMPGPHAGA